MRFLLLFLLLIYGCSNYAEFEMLYQFHLKYNKQLRVDTKLVEYTNNHCSWMNQHKKLKHSNIETLLNNYNLVAENIAYNQPDEETVFNDWMNSNGHKANILNKNFDSIGISKKENYWCVVFGKIKQ